MSGLSPLYRNNLKNQNFEIEPTRSKTDSSGCFGITPVNRYLILDAFPIGQGGSADVYRAVDQSTGKVVAAKIFHRQTHTALREHRVLKEFSGDPHIPQVHDFTFLNGNIALIMDFIPYPDLLEVR